MVTEIRKRNLQSTIEELMADLACGDVIKCQKARAALVAIGRPAVPSLITALESPEDWLRWKAAKTLSEIANPLAAEALVKALDDETPGVRWLAAEGLISTGQTAIPHLLRALFAHPDSVWLRQGARHVLHNVGKGRAVHKALKPLIAALEDIAPSVDVTLAAWNALGALNRAARE